MINQFGVRKVNITLKSDSQIWRECRQAKDFFQHKLPPVVQWRLVVSLACLSSQYTKGGRKWEQVCPSRTERQRRFLPALRVIRGPYLCNILVVCEHGSTHSVFPHILFAFPATLISKENRVLMISLA